MREVEKKKNPPCSVVGRDTLFPYVTSRTSPDALNSVGSSKLAGALIYETSISRPRFRDRESRWSGFWRIVVFRLGWEGVVGGWRRLGVERGGFGKWVERDGFGNVQVIDWI